jgi:hypothetical protein
MRGRFIGYEYDRMVVLFSMLDGQREVPCAISTSAMDDLKPAPAGKYQATEFEGTPPGIILRSLDFRKQR